MAPGRRDVLDVGEQMLWIRLQDDIDKYRNKAICALILL